MITGQPKESFPNLTKVGFAVVLRPESSAKPQVVVNTTLEYVVQEIANSISKHIGGYKTVYVNNLRPLDVCCNGEDDTNEQLEENGDQTKSKSNPVIIGTAIGGIVVLVLVVVGAVWYR